MAVEESIRSADVASHTLHMLRDIERELSEIGEVLMRRDTRLGRIEHGVNEVKSGISLIENRLLDRMNELIEIQLRMEKILER